MNLFNLSKTTEQEWNVQGSGVRIKIANNIDYYRGISRVPTAGWRNAPAYSQRGSTREGTRRLG